jgi:hypothetical protein
VPLLIQAGQSVRNPPPGAFATLDVEARDFYVRAAEHFGIAGLEALSTLNAWEDEVFEGDEVLGLHRAIRELRHRLTNAFSAWPIDFTYQQSARSIDASCPLPPERVGFLDDTRGMPFGAGGAIANLQAIESVAREAIGSGLKLLVLGD